MTVIDNAIDEFLRENCGHADEGIERGLWNATLSYYPAPGTYTRYELPDASDNASMIKKVIGPR